MPPIAVAGGGRRIDPEASDFLIVLRVVSAAAFWKDLGPDLDPFGVIFWTFIVIFYDWNSGVDFI